MTARARREATEEEDKPCDLSKKIDGGEKVKDEKHDKTDNPHSCSDSSCSVTQDESCCSEGETTITFEAEAEPVPLDAPEEEDQDSIYEREREIRLMREVKNDFAAFSRTDSFGCILDEKDYDEAVVVVALHNYESFHEIQHGTVDLEALEATSAGVKGWAASVLEGGEVKPDCSKSKDANTSNPKRHTKGDDEEAQFLQRTLLESVGVQTCHPEMGNQYEYSKDAGSTADEDEVASQYSYEDSDDSDEE